MDDSEESDDEIEFGVEDPPSVIAPFFNGRIVKASIAGRESRSTPAPRIIEEDEKQPTIPDQERLVVAVDDHPMNIDVLENLLVKKLERDVICCHSGEEALR